MKKLTVVVAALLVLLSGAVSAQTKWPGWDALDVSSFQIYVKEFGSLTSACSAGAFFTNGKTTRLLTAGHCVYDETVRYAITRDGLNFVAARVLDKGWKGSSAGAAVRAHLRLGLLTPQQVPSGVDTRGGDWAIIEVDGRLPVTALGTSKGLDLGDLLFSVGFPIGGDKMAAQGMVGNPRYNAPGTPWDGYIGARIPAAPGSSGTIVVNEKSQIIGILVAGARNDAMLHLLTPIDLVRSKVSCLDAKVCAFSGWR